MSGVATGQVLKFQIFADPALVTGVFNQIELWRSRLGEAGPFTEITAAAPAAPVVLAVSRAYTLNGKQLKLKVNESTDVTVTFSGADPIAASTIAAQIMAQAPAYLLGSVADGFIRIEGRSVGAAQTLRVVASDAASIMGLPIVEPDAVTFGLDIRQTILSGVSNYVLLDPHGDGDYFYQVRFRNSQTNAVSEFSAAFGGTGVEGGLEPSALVRGFVQLVDMLGRPMVSHTVLVSPIFNGQLVSGRMVAGAPVQQLTDDSGEASFSLVRGSRVRVAIAGTNIVREVLVPTSSAITSFNLLDPSMGTDDVFAVQVPNIPYAERRSL